MNVSSTYLHFESYHSAHVKTGVIHTRQELSITHAILSLCLKMIARVVIETLQIKVFFINVHSLRSIA